MSNDVETEPAQELISPYPRPGDGSQHLVSDIPTVPSLYEGKPITVPQHLAISAYWFATNFVWGALLEIMIPAESTHLAPHFKAIATLLLGSLSAGVALIVPLVAGALSDRCANRLGRRRPFIISGVAINVLGFLLMTLAYERAVPLASMDYAKLGTIAGFGKLLDNQGFLLFLGSYMVVQLGNNIASAAYSGVIPDLVPHNQRGAASGYMALMTQAGTLLGIVTTGLLMRDQPDSAKFAVLAIVLVVVAMVTIFGIRENPLPQKPRPINWSEYLKSLWIDPRKFPDFAWVWLTRFLVMFGFYSVLPFINFYLADVIGSPHPGEAASKVTGLILVFATVSGLVGGYISDRVGRKRVVYLSNSLIAVMALAFIACRNMEEVVLVGVLFGLGFGAYTSVDWALGTDVLPSQADAGKEMAVWHISMTLPQVVAIPIAGLLISSFGKHVVSGGDEPVVHYTLAGYSAVFILCAACFAAGAYFLRNVKGVR